jgi:hypothetical protein
MEKLTNESFKERGFKIHNGKYSYSKADLNNRDEKGRVCVTCPIHGDFWQEPNNHLRGIGCPKCANNLKKSNEEVINEIRKIYGDKYIIPKDFIYISNKKPIHLICPTHGDFYPIYHNFINGHYGCKKCSCHIYSTNEFVNDIKDIYGNMFKYDEVIYGGYRNEVTIICNKCGKTHKVLPKRLLNGTFKCDCVSCKYTFLESEISKKLDEINVEYEYQYKSNWLRNKNKLSLDFYLPKYNIGIECQGRFHFEPYKNDDEECIKNFNEQVKRDKIKYSLCKDNGVKLLYYTNKKDVEYFSTTYNDINDLIKEIK